MKTVVLFLVSFGFFKATGLAQPPPTELLSRFSTKGHPKAKGAVFTIKYPASWDAKEGERPNIVQKFVSNSGKSLENILIVTGAFPPDAPLGESDLKDLLSPESLKEMVPDKAKFISGKSTKIEGVPAGIVEFSMRESRAGIDIDMHVTAIIFFQGRTMIQVQCMVGTPSNKASELPSKISEFKPLFQLVLNSIVFDEKGK